MIRLNPNEFKEIIDYMRDTYGINLEKKKVLIECRMTKELKRQGVKSFAEYMSLLRQDKEGKLAGEMVNRLTTNYTYFMREPVHFELLERTIFQELFHHKAYGVGNIWCAGCATGEECYTLAMALEEHKAKGGQLADIRILATDISDEVLQRAKKGMYSVKELEGLRVGWRQKYCRRENEKYFVMDESLKRNIRFRNHNLMTPISNPAKFDLILCRNVMIYFDRDSRRKLVKLLEDSLNPGGYLMVGHAELLSADETELEAVYPAVYRKRSKPDK